jgi:hypothetical protein
MTDLGTQKYIIIAILTNFQTTSIYYSNYYVYSKQFNCASIYDKWAIIKLISINIFFM